MTDHAAILMAGGAGVRLWPLSTDDRPKQFLLLFDGRSLLQIAFARMNRLIDAERIFVSTNERYRSIVESQLPDLPSTNIIVEPSRKNTAPAVATSAAHVARILGSDPVIGIFPSDHYVAAEPEFIDTVRRAYAYAEREPVLMTIGIEPDHPNTGFGYLELGEGLGEGVSRVVRFVEKPPLEKAEEFLRAGNFAWNGGMFLWRQSAFEHVLATVAPEIANATARWASARPEERRSIYDSMPSISIDYAVMEKAPRVVTVRGEFGWSDVGSWRAVSTIIGLGRRRNVTRSSSENVFVESDGTRPVIILGVSNIALVDSPDGLLVIDLDQSEELSRVVGEMKKG